MLTAYRHKQNDSKEKKESAENNLSSSTLVIEEQDLLAANNFHDTAEALKASSLNPTQDQLQKKRFIDTICHELRTSLHGIDGNAHILGSIIADLEEILTCSDEKLLNLKLRDLLLDKIKLQKEGLYIIDVCAKHQKVITDDVLTMSKIESGMLALNFQPLNPKKIIKQVMDILRVEIHKKK
jgi:signal transduction histidine kinase